MYGKRGKQIDFSKNLTKNLFNIIPFPRDYTILNVSFFKMIYNNLNILFIRNVEVQCYSKSPIHLNEFI